MVPSSTFADNSRNTTSLPQTSSPAMQALYDDLAQVAQHSDTLLLVGEPGSGKTHLARLAHKFSWAARGPFIHVNCSTLMKDMAAPLLFGHKKGAFTGAYNDHQGYLQQADKGVLFLDEIGDMPLDVQSQLLTAVEGEHEFRPIGGIQTLTSKFFMVCATNKNLLQMVHQNIFRDDLLSRIHTFAYRIPPLRERKEDIPMLAQNLLDDFCKNMTPTRKEALSLTQEDMSLLTDHEWPDNIRGLRAAMERYSVLGKLDLNSHIHSLFPNGIPPSPQDQMEKAIQALAQGAVDTGATYEDIKRMLFSHILEICHGSRKDAAATLDISDKTIKRTLTGSFSSDGKTYPNPTSER
ncbi:MAG: sigma 54-interacting transcriptional regulator [Alphaproteobacteria bacterium]